jgi:hypothetical protein
LSAMTAKQPGTTVHVTTNTAYGTPEDPIMLPGGETHGLALQIT